jgi:hypothetical protein
MLIARETFQNSSLDHGWRNVSTARAQIVYKFRINSLRVRENFEEKKKKYQQGLGDYHSYY